MSSLVVDRSSERSVEQSKTAKSSSTLKYWITGIGIILGLVSAYFLFINTTLGNYEFSKVFSKDFNIDDIIYGMDGASAIALAILLRRKKRKSRTKEGTTSKSPENTYNELASNYLNNPHKKTNALLVSARLRALTKYIKITSYTEEDESFLYTATYQDSPAQIKFFHTPDQWKYVEDFRETPTSTPKAYLVSDNKGNVQIVESLEGVVSEWYLIGLIENHPFETAEYYALNLVKKGFFDKNNETKLTENEIKSYLQILFNTPSENMIYLGGGCESNVYETKYKNNQVAVKMIYNPECLNQILNLQNQSHLCLQSVEEGNHIMKPKAYILADSTGNVVVVESLDGLNENYFLIGLVKDVCETDLSKKIIPKNQRWTPPTLEQKYLWCDQLFTAVRHLEVKGILHSDLKPENVLVDGDNNLYVDDFGLASIKNIKNIGCFFRFSSPELVYSWKMDENNSEAVADNVWQLGLCIFEILFGKEFSNKCAGNIIDIIPLLREFMKLTILFSRHDNKLEAFKKYLTQDRNIDSAIVEGINPHLLENLANLLYHTKAIKSNISEAHDRLSYFDRLVSIHKAPTAVGVSESKEVA